MLGADIRSARRCDDSEWNVVSKADPNCAPSLARERLEQVLFENYFFIFFLSPAEYEIFFIDIFWCVSGSDVCYFFTIYGNTALLYCPACFGTAGAKFGSH